MARKIVHQLVDDLDGTVLEIGEGETLTFSLDGVAYEIDLTETNASALRDALAPYVAAGRRISASQSASASGRKPVRAAGLRRDPRVGQGERLLGLGARASAGIRARRVQRRQLIESNEGGVTDHPPGSRP